MQEKRFKDTLQMMINNQGDIEITFDYTNINTDHMYLQLKEADIWAEDYLKKHFQLSYDPTTKTLFFEGVKYKYRGTSCQVTKVTLKNKIVVLYERQ